MTDTKALARAKVELALQLIEEAQRTLMYAAQELSPVCYGNPEQRLIMKEYDRVHRLWYRVRAIRDKAKYGRLDLDDMAKARLAKEPTP